MKKRLVVEIPVEYEVLFRKFQGAVNAEGLKMSQKIWSWIKDYIRGDLK